MDLLTAADIQERLAAEGIEVTKRTVHNQLKDQSPVVAGEGRAPHYFEADAYDLVKTRLTEPNWAPGYDEDRIAELSAEDEGVRDLLERAADGAMFVGVPVPAASWSAFTDFELNWYFKIAHSGRFQRQSGPAYVWLMEYLNGERVARMRYRRNPDEPKRELETPHLPVQRWTLRQAADALLLFTQLREAITSPLCNRTKELLRQLILICTVQISRLAKRIKEA